MTPTATTDDSASASGPFEAHTYDARLYGPLFFASKEGSVIETDPVVAATALMHALGYQYYELGKPFALAGDAATAPDYSHLRDLPVFTSEMTRRRSGDGEDEWEVNERTFRTVAYTTERALVSSDGSVGEYIRDAQKPLPRRIEGSNSAWHKMREFVGIPPGATFEFTVWSASDDAPPDALGFRTGIKRTGEVRAERRSDPAETVTLNQFLLQSVYDIGEDAVFDIMDRADDYQRGNDVRTNRFVGVDADWFATEILPEVLSD
jgi:CRISPR-associated protein Csc1